MAIDTKYTNKPQLAIPQPEIKTITPVTLPDPISGVKFMMYGLGADNRLYIWDGDLHGWVAQ